MAGKAFGLFQATVQMDYIHCSSSLMQVVDVLRDHRYISRPCQLRNGLMRSVGHRLRDLRPPP
jgi:hypothetical protein